MASDPPERENTHARPGGAPSSDGRASRSPRGRAQISALASLGERLLIEGDQTASETDQTLSEADHSAAESDQTSAERDQVASDSDQAASDHDLASGVNRAAHELSRGIRQRSTAQRGQTARERLRISEQRDAVAHLRDLAALARDQAADARDVAMGQLDTAAGQTESTRPLTGLELVMRAAEQRKRTARHRAQAAVQRLLAAQDRHAAARDREQAARERDQALADRQALTIELERAAVDPLTGARTRAAGLRELDHELDRARRTASPLSVAYIDVVGLKSVNDTLGHAAGDALLKHVVAHLQAHLRPYDLIIRLGGDEFLFAMPNVIQESARERFASIAGALNRGSNPVGIRTGVAELRDHESASELIERADSELIRTGAVQGAGSTWRSVDPGRPC
jgi:diguanylate cyclase (GGDEF)-like protein